MLNDLKPTPAAQVNGTTTHLVQYLRAFYTPRAYVDLGVLQGAAQVQANVLAANASITDTNGYEYSTV